MVDHPGMVWAVVATGVRAAETTTVEVVAMAVVAAVVVSEAAVVRRQTLLLATPLSSHKQHVCLPYVCVG